MAIRDRIAWLRAPRNTPHTSSPNRTEPWWVKLLTDFGRPAVAVIVMVMCAPGEHHLGVLAGWDSHLAWGMAAVLAAYAGIAAVVATRRPKGSPGKGTAVAGAILSLAAAMAAQPVSHAFVTGWLSATPRSPLTLVIAVSCVPALVFGHLLHLAAAHGVPTETPQDAAETPETASVPEPVKPTPAPVVPTGARMLTATPCGTRPAVRDTRDGAEGKQWLSTAAVAIRYGVDASTVRTWIDRGVISSAGKDSRGHHRFDPSQLPDAPVPAASHG